METALNARSTGIDGNRADGMPFDDMECLPARLLQCVRALGTDAIVVRYEDMIAEPETALRRLCARLGIVAEPAMFELAAQFKQFGSDDAPQQDAWIERVSVNGLAPQVREYLEGLGAATVEGLGYTYATAVERLSSATGCASAAVNARMAKTVVTDGERRFAEGDLDTAEQLFHTALDLDASNTDALNNLGVLHWERGDTATALEYLARGLSVAPGDRSMITNTATVLHALGNTEDAVALCRGYLEKHPDDVDLRTLLDTIKTDLHSQDGFRQAH